VWVAACAGGSGANPVPPTTFAALAGLDTFRTATVAPGVTRAYAWDAIGPWGIHAIEIDSRRCVPIVRARKAGPPLSARARTSALAADDIAAVNADFFQLPGGTPVGASVAAGHVLAGPGVRPVFAAHGSDYWIDAARVDGIAVVRADTVRVTQVNRPLQDSGTYATQSGVVYYDAWYGDSVSAPALRLRRLEGGAGSVRAIVTGMLDDTLATRLTADALALRAAGAGDAWLRMRRPGDTVDIRIAVVSASRGAPATEAVGGFPLLVRAGRNFVAEQAGIVATFGPARHPRTAVGWSADPPRLFWVVVDGRQAGYSAGMTLDELAALMLRLGAREALNLDGGGSSALVVRGMVRNRPSDATGERAVGNALALERCG
jgi:hypothetical protein